MKAGARREERKKERPASHTTSPRLHCTNLLLILLFELVFEVLLNVVEDGGLLFENRLLWELGCSRIADCMEYMGPGLGGGGDRAGRVGMKAGLRAIWKPVQYNAMLDPMHRLHRDMLQRDMLTLLPCIRWPVCSADRSTE